MRRSNDLNSNSLELLLDTICNTFGGILFLALLFQVGNVGAEPRTVPHEIWDGSEDSLANDSGRGVHTGNMVAA